MPEIQGSCPATGRSASACTDQTHVGCWADKTESVALDLRVAKAQAADQDWADVIADRRAAGQGGLPNFWCDQDDERVQAEAREINRRVDLKGERSRERGRPVPSFTVLAEGAIRGMAPSFRCDNPNHRHPSASGSAECNRRQAEQAAW